MIARLSGTLVEKSVTQCVVDVHGVAYRVVVPLSTFTELPEVGEPTVIHIHTHVREDAIQLYGFHVPAEREVFELMISVSGIGPKLAVNILSGITAGELIRAVKEEDLRRLTAIPGVGRKTAERMVLELKDKAARIGWEPATGQPVTAERGGAKEDALSALVNLGYRGAAAKEAVEKVIRETQEPQSLDRLLKQALRFLAG
ncbi:MAG: Holliday junction branch migration protein RuvA [Syntrophales bacterium]